LHHHHPSSTSACPSPLSIARQGAQRPQLASPTFTTAQPPPAAKTHHLQATLLSSSFVTEGGERGHAAHPCSIATAASLLPASITIKKAGQQHVDHHQATLAIIEHAGKKGCSTPAIAILPTPTTANPHHPPPGEEFTACPTSHIIADNRGEGGQRRLPFAHLYRCRAPPRTTPPFFIIIIPHPHPLAHHHCRSLGEVPSDHDLPRPPSPLLDHHCRQDSPSPGHLRCHHRSLPRGEKEVTQHILVPSLLLPAYCLHRSPSRKRGDNTSITTEATLAIIEHAGKKGCDALAIAILPTPTTADPHHPPPGEEFTARPTSHIIADNRGEGGQRRIPFAHLYRCRAPPRT
ncbi:hypothetical protein Dimus_024860, partial [Dionaea muscipula]